MSAKWKTSSPPVSPAQGRRVRDKIEVSPTSQATCRKCINKIMKGDTRVGIQGKVEVKRGLEVWQLHWYHEGCVTEETKAKLYLAGAPSAARKQGTKNNNNNKKAASPRKKRAVTIDDSDNDKKPAAKKTKMNPKSPTKTEEGKAGAKKPSAVVTPIKQKGTRHMLKPSIRKLLETDLREFRKCFSKVQHCDEHQIFPYKTLQEIIQTMPATKAELITCWGIAGKRCDQYGEPILQIVGSYLDRYQNKAWKEQGQMEDGGSNYSIGSAGEADITGEVVGSAGSGTISNNNSRHAVAAAAASASDSAINNGKEVSNDEDDDEVVEAGPTLSVEEIVRQRVREFKERGEVFEILD